MDHNTRLQQNLRQQKKVKSRLEGCRQKREERDASGRKGVKDRLEDAKWRLELRLKSKTGTALRRLEFVESKMTTYETLLENLKSECEHDITFHADRLDEEHREYSERLEREKLRYCKEIDDRILKHSQLVDTKKQTFETKRRNRYTKEIAEKEAVKTRYDTEYVRIGNEDPVVQSLREKIQKAEEELTRIREPKTNEEVNLEQELKRLEDEADELRLVMTEAEIADLELKEIEASWNKQIDDHKTAMANAAKHNEDMRSKALLEADEYIKHEDSYVEIIPTNADSASLSSDSSASSVSSDSDSSESEAEAESAPQNELVQETTQETVQETHPDFPEAPEVAIQQLSAMAQQRIALQKRQEELIKKDRERSRRELEMKNKQIEEDRLRKQAEARAQKQKKSNVKPETMMGLFGGLNELIDRQVVETCSHCQFDVRNHSSKCPVKYGIGATYSSRSGTPLRPIRAH